MSVGLRFMVHVACHQFAVLAEDEFAVLAEDEFAVLAEV